jgi:hypothetical protein
LFASPVFPVASVLPLNHGHRRRDAGFQHRHPITSASFPAPGRLARIVEFTSRPMRARLVTGNYCSTLGAEAFFLKISRRK